MVDALSGQGGELHLSVHSLVDKRGWGIPVVRRYRFQSSNSTYNALASNTYVLDVLPPQRAYYLKYAYVRSQPDQNTGSFSLLTAVPAVTTIAADVAGNTLKTGSASTWSAAKSVTYFSLSSQSATLCLAHDVQTSTNVDLDFYVEEVPMGNDLADWSLKTFSVLS